MKITSTTATLFLAMVLVVSCNSGKEKKSEANSETNSLEEVMKAANAISSEITNVDDVFKTLELVDAGYYPILCNDPYSATSYLNSKTVAAANLGVYITDIVYHMYGDASSEMFISFSASQELAKYIGLESEFAATLLTELEGGDVSRDSLILVFNGLMKDSEKYGSENEMAYVHTSFLTGLYIEKLFITSSLLDQAFDKQEKNDQDVINTKKLLVVFQNQLKSLPILMGSLNGQEENLSDVINTGEFDALTAGVASFEANVESLLNSEKLDSSADVTALHNQLTTIRNRIVSAS